VIVGSKCPHSSLVFKVNKSRREREKLKCPLDVFHISGKMIHRGFCYSARLGRPPLKPAALAVKRESGPLEESFPLFFPSPRP